MKAGSVKRVAVTGASGFIGKHVLSELSMHPVDVIAVVRNTEKSVPAESGAEIRRFDLAGSSDNDFELLGRPDALIHLAWDGLHDYRSPLHLERELPMHYRFLRGLVHSGLSVLVATGTCFEYGMQSGPLSEKMETNPNTAYGRAKDTLRRQIEHLRTTGHFSLTWARLFYLYGEGQNEKSLWPQLKQSAERGDKFFSMSGGEQVRDYLHVKDAAKYIVMAALDGTDMGVVNICSGKPVSVRDMVERWIKENKWSIELNLGCYPYPDYEPMAFWGDPGRLNMFLKDIRNRK
jgi:dTDP-6-deoxy-L-talose 4-dehydrogenase (NAD+)